MFGMSTDAEIPFAVEAPPLASPASPSAPGLIAIDEEVDAFLGQDKGEISMEPLQ
jgi:hypothetical protein